MRRILTRGLIAVLILAALLLYSGKQTEARLHYADNPLAANWDGEGPYVSMTEGGEMRIHHLRADGAAMAGHPGHRSRAGPTGSLRPVW